MIEKRNWAGKRAFVTGAGGFIGSHLVDALVGSGAQVNAFVRYNSRGDSGHLRLLTEGVRENIKVIAGDLRDPQAVQNAMQGCESVFHLGALISLFLFSSNRSG